MCYYVKYVIHIGNSTNHNIMRQILIKYGKNFVYKNTVKICIFIMFLDQIGHKMKLRVYFILLEISL